MFTLKDIKGAVVEKKIVSEQDLYKAVSLNGFWKAYRKGFGKAIDAQSSVKLRLNREKLAEEISDALQTGCLNSLLGICENPDYKKASYVLANAIIAADKEIVEVCND